MDNTLQKIFSLEEMAQKTSEAERFADYLENRGLLCAPQNLKSSILEQSRRMDTGLEAKKRRLSQKAELFFYGLKVGFAVACCVFAIAAIPPLGTSRPFFPIREHTPFHVGAYEKLQEWNGKIDRFSKSLFHLEVSIYD